MKTVLKLAAMACLVSLGACSRGATENNAANIEATAENTADNLDALAGNASNEQVADNLSNSAEAVRDAGSAANNVESNTVGM